VRQQPTSGRERPDPIRRHIATRGSQRSALSPGLLLTAGLSVLAVMALGCSSTKKATTTVPTSTSSGVTTATTGAPATTTPSAAPATTGATTAPATTASATADLSGTWSGQYSGAYQGTFTLTWQQSGSTLSGSIKLSAPAVTLNINGTVQGNAIRFGTVGSVGITYSGSVSGNSMSGTYQAGTTGGGPWSATKSS
jgi:hypothetical protein